MLIFFSGHGLSEVAEDTSQAFLLEHDSDPQDNGTSSFSLAKLQDLVRAGPATARVLLFADIGRLPEYQGSPNRINQATAAVLSGGRISGILAGSPKEISVVVDDPRGGHGVFTATLLAGLRSSVPDLFAYIEEQVPKATNNQQHPLHFGEPPRPLVLGAGGPPPPRRPAYRTPPLLASLGPGAANFALDPWTGRTPPLFSLEVGSTRPQPGSPPERGPAEPRPCRQRSSTPRPSPPPPAHGRTEPLPPALPPTPSPSKTKVKRSSWNISTEMNTRPPRNGSSTAGRRTPRQAAATPIPF